MQRLLVAKRDLWLERELVTLDIYHAVILDNIGYVQQSRDEMEVLFTFLAERYEGKSVLITSNLVFSDWIRIFKNPMTTGAAIDRHRDLPKAHPTSGRPSRGYPRPVFLSAFDAQVSPRSGHGLAP